MPERKREAWVPDAEARELDLMFILRDIRRRESLPGTVCQYIGAGRRPQISRKDSRGRLSLRRRILLYGGFMLLVLALGVVGSVETGRMEILPGVLLMIGFGGMGVMAMEGSGMLR